MFYRDVSFLQKILTGPLPGRAHQLPMAPYHRLEQLRENVIPDDARTGCTLLLLFPGANLQTLFVLIRRNEYAGTHSGQISFPGGKPKPGEAMHKAALRETHEETGVHPDSITLLGELTPLYIPPSNFLVYPFVGFVEHTPPFNPDPREVKEILKAPVDALLQKETRQDAKVKVSDNNEITVPAYILEGHPVWGATAMMLSEFAQIWGNK